MLFLLWIITFQLLLHIPNIFLPTSSLFPTTSSSTYSLTWSIFYIFAINFYIFCNRTTSSCNYTILLFFAFNYCFKKLTSSFNIYISFYLYFYLSLSFYDLFGLYWFFICFGVRSFVGFSYNLFKICCFVFVFLSVFYGDLDSFYFWSLLNYWNYSYSLLDFNSLRYFLN